MTHVLREVEPALRVMLVALGGVGMAAWWFDGHEERSFFVLAALVVLGYAVELLGQTLLPRRPVAAVLLMEWWALVPMALAAAAAAAVIVVAVETTLPEEPKPSTQTKELVGALATALSTFLTSGFVSAVGDRDKSAVGDRVKTRLRRHFAPDSSATGPSTKPVPAGHPIEQLLYSDNFLGLSGWDRETRLARAREIAKRLESLQ